MSPQDFVYWLNGFVELGGDKNPPDEAQWKMICEHLKLTMVKVTPPLERHAVQTDPDWIKKAIETLDKKLDKKADKFVHPLPATPYDPSPGLPGVQPSPFVSPQQPYQFPPLDWTWRPDQTVITC